ncbi:Myosin type-2 heavy chain 1 [Pichia californica]|uniref:Myosin type-2 heavy chain 1 n=1 Tax=Pichia californica TaxID=460514 RepID=A0A9P6WL10_9ASCO|nr:Myosin type-2 heavy chain 1 [[Candida] californica]
MQTFALCWIPDEKLGWLAVRVQQITNNDNKYQIKLEVENDPENIITIETNTLDESNPEVPLMRNQAENVEDLTTLSHLNEPSVLNVIKLRYSQFNIYTYSGIVLIAVNPFQRNDELYSPYRIKRYANTRRGDEEPHLFAIAEEAYRCMINRKQNQSIVVSGESGAGKTVSAKYIMRYFASVDSDENHHDMSETEKQILATNPIMESFGNAKTTRNDNSSRFGKYLEILFDNKTVICGAKIRTYLLERSRLVFQPKTERNYHIFYQMIQGLDEDIKKSIHLQDIEYYHYLNQGGIPLIDGIDDKKEFHDTCQALSLVGIDQQKQLEIFKILSGLLHLGNIEIPKTRNNASLSSDEPSLVKACELLGLDPVQFAKWTVKKQIKTRFETINTDLKHNEAINARDAVAKFIYHNLFDWLVDHVNSDLFPPELEKEVSTFIGVLDIYGFEHFDKNSFEQFCINYANEKLQQEFTQHVFKLEQQLYIDEDIEWSFIEFADNQPCIDVIEKKLGVLDLLNEESRLPAGSDQQWTDKLYSNLAKHPTDSVFKKPRFGNNKFIISHYALDVPYDTEGFVEKNRDTVSDGQKDTLKTSTNSFLLDVLSTSDKQAEIANNVEVKPGRKGPAKETLGSKFKGSLIDLMKTINSSNVHYIRCIKPNEEKKAWEFDPNMVLSQLRACGVLETIKISCAGFPSKMSYPEFADSFNVLFESEDRYRLLQGRPTEDDMKNATQVYLDGTINDNHSFQIGKSKVFFKAGILGNIEKIKSDKHKKSAIIIQKHLRGYQDRKEYQEIRTSAINLQSIIRGFLVRGRIQKEKEREGATLLQSLCRGYITRTRFDNAIKSLIELQSVIRGKNIRENIHRNIRNNAAVTIQSLGRGYLARKECNKFRRAAIIIQCCTRKQLAKKRYAKLKEEAKSVNRMQEVQYGLENKVIELTQSLSSKIEENNKLMNEIQQLQTLVEKTQTDHSSLKAKSIQIGDEHNAKVAEYEESVSTLNGEIDRLKIDYDTAKQKVDELTESQSKIKEELKETLDQLKKAQEELNASNDERDTLYGSVEKLKSELKELQDHLSSGKFNNTTLASIPNGNNGLTFNEANRDLSDNVEYINEEDNDELEAINRELNKLLDDSKSLHKEVVEGLFKGLHLPPAVVASQPSKKEVLFPARIIIIILSDMWRLGLTSHSESFFGEVLSVIQSMVSDLNDDDVISHGAYWLTNTHELYSFVSYAQSTIVSNDEVARVMGEDEYNLFLKLIADAKEDFESLSYNIYNIWMKKIMSILEKKVISAVVLGQSLPGFMSQDASPLISKMFTKDPKYKMDDILTFFNNVYWAMKSYYFEELVMDTVIIELLKFVNSYCFNDLMLRRNFLSWKRGLQLNYNVMRLDEWCKGHGINDATVYLSHLFQVSKLLQLRKNTPEDIDIIYEICNTLKPVQIQKLFSLYHVADYEVPISPMITQGLAEKVRSSGQTDYMEPVNKDTLFDDPFRNIELRPFNKIEAYVPARLNVPIIRRIIELSTLNATYQSNVLPDNEE